MTRASKINQKSQLCSRPGVYLTALVECSRLRLIFVWTRAMAKRFIDTGIFNSPSIRKFPGKLKLFWVYLFTNCDHAGIWVKDFEAASMFMGMEITESEAIKHLDGKIIKIENGERWFLPGFIKFQYPTGLNEKNAAHKSVLAILKEFNIGPTLAPTIAPIEGLHGGAKDMDIVKDKEREMVKDIEKQAKEILEYLSKQTGREYKDQECMAIVIENLSNSHTYEDHMQVINVKIHDDFFKNNPRCYHPSTIFGPKFGKYKTEKIEDFQPKKKNPMGKKPEGYYD